MPPDGLYIQKFCFLSVYIINLCNPQYTPRLPQDTSRHPPDTLQRLSRHPPDTIARAGANTSLYNVHANLFQINTGVLQTKADGQLHHQHLHVEHRGADGWGDQGVERSAWCLPRGGLHFNALSRRCTAIIRNNGYPIKYWMFIAINIFVLKNLVFFYNVAKKGKNALKTG